MKFPLIRHTGTQATPPTSRPSRRRRYEYIEPRVVKMQARPGAPHREDASGRDAPRGHLLFLHGWNLSSRSLHAINRALGCLPHAQDWWFWDIDYKTHWQTAGQSAGELADLLLQQPHDFSNTVLIGYSMGGVVARHMVSQGFPCRALVSICSPHEGLAPWMPCHSPGTRSLSRRSRELSVLNQNPVDVASRERYHFFAVTYRDILGFHAHDSVVMASSALGHNLGSVGGRQEISLDYRGRLAAWDPHTSGIDTLHLGALIETCEGLMCPDQAR